MDASFFKVLIGDFSTRLPISPAFVQHFPVLRSRKAVTLQNSKKVSWNVELKKTDGYVFFEKGWSSFVSENSLEIGEFLVFKFNGDSIFRVVFYGIHGVEKSLVASVTTTKKNYEDSRLPEKRQDENETTPIIAIHTSSEDNDEIGSRSSSSMGNRNKTATKLTVPKKENGQGGKQFSDEDSDDDDDEEEDSDDDDESKMTFSSPNASKVNRKKTNALSEEAEKFKSVHPFFKATMGQTYTHKSHVNFPSKIVKHMNREAEFVRLVFSNKSMQVKLISNDDRLWLSIGWNKFVKEHNLEEGDVLIFELIDISSLVFQVSLFRSSSC